MHLSQQDGQRLIEKFGTRITVGPSVQEALARVTVKQTPAKVASEPSKAPKGPRKKSSGELRYAEFLEAAHAAGVIQYWHSEPWTIRLADHTTYRPDFFVALADGRPCLVEIKGHWQWDDAKVKYKVAREIRPEYLWLALEWKQGKWRILFKNGYEPLVLIP